MMLKRSAVLLRPGLPPPSARRMSRLPQWTRMALYQRLPQNFWRRPGLYSFHSPSQTCRSPTASKRHHLHSCHVFHVCCTGLVNVLPSLVLSGSGLCPYCLIHDMPFSVCLHVPSPAYPARHTLLCVGICMHIAACLFISLVPRLGSGARRNQQARVSLFWRRMKFVDACL